VEAYAALAIAAAIGLAIVPLVVFLRRLGRPGPSDQAGKVVASIAIPVFIAGGAACALIANDVSTRTDGSTDALLLVLFTLPCLIAAAVVSLGLKTLLKR